jgi:hypothetical protein
MEKKFFFYLKDKNQTIRKNKMKKMQKKTNRVDRPVAKHIRT